MGTFIRLLRRSELFRGEVLSGSAFAWKKILKNNAESFLGGGGGVVLLGLQDLEKL